MSNLSDLLARYGAVGPRVADELVSAVIEEIVARADSGSAPTLAALLAAGNDPGTDANHKQIEAAGTEWAGGGWLELRPPNEFGDTSGDAGIIAGEAKSGHGGGAAILYGGEREGGNQAGYVLAYGTGADDSGGGVDVTAGSAGAGSGKDGGDIALIPGTGDGVGRSGQIVIDGLIVGTPNVLVQAAEDGTGFGAQLALDAAADDGTAYLQGGNIGAGDGQGGGVQLIAGSSFVGGDGNGGDVTIIAGMGHGAGRAGQVIVTLPTSDPGVAGALWSNSNTVKVSAG